jgi:DNA-binding NarL/FixJ family response regulator
MRTATPSPARVLLVEHHPAVRMTVLRLLDARPELRSVAFGTAADALEAAAAEPFDIAVVNQELGAGEDGLTLTRDLRCLAAPPRVLVYSAHADTPLAALAVVAGADGVLTMALLGIELGNVVRDILNGGLRRPVLPAPIIASLERRLPAKERQLFAMWTAGAADAEVAAAGGLTAQQLERARRAILTTLGGRAERPRLPCDDGAWPLSFARSNRIRRIRS